MRAARRLYSEDEDGFLRANYRSMPSGDIARHLGRGVVSVRKRAAKLGLSSPLKRWGSEEDEVIRSAWGNKRLAKVARELGRSVSEVSSRAKALGCSPWRIRKGTHAGRPIDGFKNGRPVYTHRAVVERRLGRRLSSDEIVHHIDADKTNNKSSNLYVFKSRAAHRKAHCTLESLVPLLLARGIVRFDVVNGVYELCETSN